MYLLFTLKGGIGQGLGGGEGGQYGGYSIHIFDIQSKSSIRLDMSM